MDTKSKTTEIRPIANGWIRRESSWDGDDHTSEETFHKDEPQFEARQAPLVAPVNRLARAVGHLNAGKRTK